ncbi:hypothetical protein SynNOUM97013_01638 [Synechococcus sp. NOUM97013]|nr:hypothetical protein SynNOUM97013_01638 [Synechococcus sp. NOUM97013]
MVLTLHRSNAAFGGADLCEHRRTFSYVKNLTADRPSLRCSTTSVLQPGSPIGSTEIHLPHERFLQSFDPSAGDWSPGAHGS